MLERIDDHGIAQLRVPPHSVEAESAVLGSLLQDNAIWDKVADLVGEGDFYRYEHRLIFAVVRALMLAGKPADILTAHERLKTQGKDAEVGGLAYLQRLTDAPPSRANARRYAEIVRDHSVRRRLVSASDEISTLAFNPGDKPIAACLDLAQQKLHDIHVGTGRVMPTSIEASVASFIDRLQEAQDGDKPRGISTGFPMLDRMLGGGFKGGKQIILAARPSIGKSSLAEQLCLHLARHEVGAAFFSQEMTKDELTDRAIANLARVQLDRIISGRLDPDDRARLNEGIERIRGLKLYFDDQPALTLTDIAAKARMVVRQYGVKLIVIDYIQLCGSADGSDEKSRHHQIEQLSRGIKTLSKQLDVTFLTLSQLNREVEKRTNGRPVLSDLKESGSIEEDADVVMLLSRGPTTQSGMQIVNCDVPKNRQGRTGSFSMMFEGPYQQWSESAVPVEWKASPAKKTFTEEV